MTGVWGGGFGDERRCGSPALREEIFCYSYQRMIRGVRLPPRSRGHSIAMPANFTGFAACRF